jgi:hypothetical protein
MSIEIACIHVNQQYRSQVLLRELSSNPGTSRSLSLFRVGLPLTIVVELQASRKIVEHYRGSLAEKECGEIEQSRFNDAVNEGRKRQGGTERIELPAHQSFLLQPLKDPFGR